MHNTIIVKVILSRDITLGNFFFVRFRNQYTRLEIEVTSNGETRSLLFDNIPRSTSDMVSQWMDRNYTKLPVHNELTTTEGKKEMLLVISGGYG